MKKRTQEAIADEQRKERKELEYRRNNAKNQTDDCAGSKKRRGEAGSQWAATPRKPAKKNGEKRDQRKKQMCVFQ